MGAGAGGDVNDIHLAAPQKWEVGPVLGISRGFQVTGSNWGMGGGELVFCSGEGEGVADGGFDEEVGDVGVVEDLGQLGKDRAVPCMAVFVADGVIAEWVNGAWGGWRRVGSGWSCHVCIPGRCRGARREESMVSICLLRRDGLTEH